MRRMLVHQCQSRIAEKKLRHDQQSNVFFTIESLLEDVTSVAIGRKFDHSTSAIFPPLVRETHGNGV